MSKKIVYDIGVIDLTQIVPSRSKDFLKINLGGKMNKCNVRVLGDEGQIPHFHIESQTSILICYMCIFVPSYFIHKNRKNTTLDKDQLKYLNSWLKEIDPKKDPNFTRWQLIVDRWKVAGNPLTNWTDQYTAVQPDFTSVNSVIKE